VFLWLIGIGWIAYNTIRSQMRNWFFSELVEESLVNFQRKVSQVMKTIGFTFNDLDFVINPFQLTSMEGILTMVQNAIAMAFKHFYKAVQSAMIQRAGQFTPMIQCLASPSSGSIGPDMFKLVF